MWSQNKTKNLNFTLDEPENNNFKSYVKLGLKKKLFCQSTFKAQFKIFILKF